MAATREAQSWPLGRPRGRPGGDCRRRDPRNPLLALPHPRFLKIAGGGSPSKHSKANAPPPA